MAIYANENGTLKTLADDSAKVLMFKINQWISPTTPTEYQHFNDGTYSITVVDVYTYDVVPKAILIAPKFYGSNAYNDSDRYNAITFAIGNSAYTEVANPKSSFGSTVNMGQLNSVSITVGNNKITVRCDFSTSDTTVRDNILADVLIFY